MMEDVEKTTVAFGRNYDQNETEPLVFPAKVPNLLLNGGSGIAVGMATNTPPHHLGELCDAITLAIDKPEATLDELMTKMPRPDFPTAGRNLGPKGNRPAQANGPRPVNVPARHSERAL